MERWIRSEQVYRGKIVDIRAGEVRLDDGREAFREVIEHPGGVAVAPLLGDRVLFAKQYRIAIEKDLIELPAGKLEGDEDPEHRGRMELEEEIGYRAGRMEYVGYFYPSPGVFNEKLHIYIATELVETEQRQEYDENIEVVSFTLDEIRGMLQRHEFEDGKTIIGLHALLMREA